jgi:uncharacterized protein YjbI with pentapeptide repeats
MMAHEYPSLCGCGADFCTSQNRHMSGDSYDCVVPSEYVNDVTIDDNDGDTLKIDFSDTIVEHAHFDDGVTISEGNLSGSEVEQLDAANVVIDKCNFNNAKLKDTNFREAVLKNVSLVGTVLKDAVLRGTRIAVTALSNANFSGSDLSESALFPYKNRNSKINIKSCSFCGVDLKGAKITDTKFIDCDLSDTKLTSKTGIHSTNINRVSFIDCNFSRTNIEVIGLDNIKLTNQTKLGEKPPENIPEYDAARKIYKKAENQCMSNGLRNLRKQAKLLWAKTDAQRARQRGEYGLLARNLIARVLTAYGTSDRRPLVCSAVIISLYAVAYMIFGVGGSGLSVVSYAAQTFLFTPPFFPNRSFLKLLVYSEFLWKLLLIRPFISSIYRVWGRYR